MLQQLILLSFLLEFPCVALVPHFSTIRKQNCLQNSKRILHLQNQHIWGTTFCSQKRYHSSPLVCGHRRSSDSENNVEGDGGVKRFLGKGERAIVRPGVVLVAPSNEFHHFYRKAAIFIYAMGEIDNFDETDTSGDYIIRGVIVDHPTVFTLSEMMEHQESVANNPLGGNLLFRGGDRGGDGVILLHSRSELAHSAIGESGIFQGGWKASLHACANGDAKVEEFKAFFNYCEFTERELEKMLAEGDDEGDAWMSLEVEPEIILDSTWDRGEAWTRLRNAIKQRMT